MWAARKGGPMKKAYVIGTLDTKQHEIAFVADILTGMGIPVCVVDVGIFPCEQVAGNWDVVVLRDQDRAFFAGITDRGKALERISQLLEAFLPSCADLGGVMGMGGSGNTAVVTRGMRALPVGTPKLMVSTVASGDVAPYVGPTDICMMPSVADVQGINRITRRILGNAAHALGGMLLHSLPPAADSRELVGMTMFGVTTPCVQHLCALLEADYEPLVFHATGTGGRAFEKLVDSGMLHHVLDMTLTEICDLHMGGNMSAGEDRLGAIIRSGIPYVGSVGALDMVNFAAMPTVPEKYRDRNLYVHNANVTLMRTTPEENARMGQWIAERLNRMPGAVRFLLPEGGVSAIDAPGMPFYDPEADAALFSALETHFRQDARHQLLRIPAHINDPAFAAAAVAAFRQITN